MRIKVDKTTHNKLSLRMKLKKLKLKPRKRIKNKKLKLRKNRDQIRRKNKLSGFFEILKGQTWKSRSKEKIKGNKNR